MVHRLNRRNLLRAGATGGAVAGAIAGVPLLLSGNSTASNHIGHETTPSAGGTGNELEQASQHAAHSPSATIGDIDVAQLGIDPSDFIQTFDYGEATTMADGTVVREWELIAIDREIEIAPGVFFPAWTYNGQVPGPTLRANEGDLLRIHFVNGGAHPHTIHFHGIHGV